MKKLFPGVDAPLSPMLPPESAGPAPGPPVPHRYIARVRTLLERVDRVLRERDARLEILLFGADHTGHFFPDAVPELAAADFVSLELPTTPVKAYLETPEDRP